MHLLSSYLQSSDVGKTHRFALTTVRNKDLCFHIRVYNSCYAGLRAKKIKCTTHSPYMYVSHTVGDANRNNSMHETVSEHSTSRCVSARLYVNFWGGIFRASDSTSIWKRNWLCARLDDLNCYPIFKSGMFSDWRNEHLHRDRYEPLVTVAHARSSLAMVITKLNKRFHSIFKFTQKLDTKKLNWNKGMRKILSTHYTYMKLK
jgi:hypothetical protein